MCKNTYLAAEDMRADTAFERLHEDLMCITLLAEESVSCDKVDIADALLCAWGCANMKEIRDNTATIIEFASPQTRRIHSTFKGLVEAYTDRIRAHHAYLRAGMRASVGVLGLEDELREQVSRIRKERQNLATQLRSVSASLMNEIRDDTGITGELYRMARDEDERFEKQIKLLTACEKRLVYDHRARFAIRSPLSEQRDETFLRALGSHSRRTEMLQKCPGAEDLTAILMAGSVPEIHKILEKFMYLTEQNLGDEDMPYLKAMYEAIDAKNVGVHATTSLDDNGVAVTLTGNPTVGDLPHVHAFAQQYADRVLIIYAYIEYLKIHRAHVRAAARLPSHLVEETLSRKMIDKRNKIRKERERDADIMSKEADELEAGLYGQ
jgi:hypothetical protein